VSITYCVCVTLVIQHAVRMRRIGTCGLPRSTIRFAYYLINSTIFENKVTEHKMCIRFPLQLLSETFLILRRNERDMMKRYIGLHVKCRLLSSHSNVT